MDIFLFAFALFHFYIPTLFVLIIMMNLPKFARIRKKLGISLAALFAGGLLFFTPVFFFEGLAAALAGPNGGTVWDDGYRELGNMFKSNPPRPLGRTDGVDVAMDTVNFYADRGIRYALYDISGAPDPSIEADHPLDLAGYHPVGGGIVRSLYGGGSRECCLNLPKNSKEGRYMLKWEEVGEGKEKLYSQELTLPAYDSPDNVFIVFLEGHKAELVVGGGYPGEPGWMGSVKGGTLGACLRAHDRAHCYKNLPHYDNDADNQAESWRIRCREQKNSNEKIEIFTKENQVKQIEFLNALLKEHEADPNYGVFNQKIYFEIQREKRGNRIGKTYCELWSEDCAEDFDMSSYDSVSNKEMCKIDWRSPVFGE